ncbi:mandelate racemase/muconate lactonizing enzyme family protein [Roseomonas terrae]|jgi:D-galactarolactone cycloisomerase|uniref:Mandelate racemase/muconate lactonizing enzyme family protein n=1 Tax=Neoroseomonas terrae TaxID=424799 RepID=A0ABS5EAK8_9PROT|nr:mandelate racemase/muconate lactonizing enzyme family protein [Neoroseomonas terrae]MBR0648053.1 mandelate racemase/muconate lactonizing enzyme family protein [Neoroseomonas terrae]
MKITRVESIPLRIPFTHGGPPLSFAGKPRTTMDTLLVRVETEEGLVGWGDGFGASIFPNTKLVLDEFIAPLVTGRSFDDPAALSEELQVKLHNLGRGGPPIYALSGLDIALWDLAGKAAGTSLSTMLGARRTSLRAYASLLRYGVPELVATNVTKALRDGFELIKLHEITLEASQAARDAAGPSIPIMVDTNCPWRGDEAVHNAQLIAKMDPLWIEEPVWPPEDHETLARVRREARIPVAAGENAANATALIQMLSASAVDYAQPSVSRIGGITEFLKVSAAARQHGVKLAPHSPYFGPGFVATLHLLAAEEADIAIERFFLDLETTPFAGQVDVIGGRVAVPTGPGLGVEPDPALIARYRTA